MHLTLDSLTKSYGFHHVLNGVSMEFRPAAITVLLGANGAGKTTLLRCLSGLSSGESGAVRLDGVALTPGDLERRRRLMFLPDFPPHLPAGDLLEHVAMHLKIWQKDRPGIEDSVLHWMEELDLTDLTGRPVENLSRGERYKVALLCLLAVDPDLWLLDEPFASGMDAQGIAVFRREVRQAAERGRTIIYSTQLVELAATFSDATAVVGDGRVTLYDTAADFSRDPQLMEERLFPSHHRRKEDA